MELRFPVALFTVLSILCNDLFHESGLKMAAPIDIISVLLGRKSYGRNGHEPKLFLAENEQSAAGGL